MALIYAIILEWLEHIQWIKYRILGQHDWLKWRIIFLNTVKCQLRFTIHINIDWNYRGKPSTPQTYFFSEPCYSSVFLFIIIYSIIIYPCWVQNYHSVKTQNCLSMSLCVPKSILHFYPFYSLFTYLFLWYV